VVPHGDNIIQFLFLTLAVRLSLCQNVLHCRLYNVIITETPRNVV
jgi:hypothetical protein